MISLRPYQQDMVSKISTSLRTHQRVLAQAPTGAGKTVLSSHMMGQSASHGWKVWFVVHRKELVEQTSNTMRAMGLNHGFVAAGFPRTYDEPILLCSVQTLATRCADLVAAYGEPNIVFWDEAHHCAAGTWEKVASYAPRSRHVGLTATPERLDGKGLNGLFNSLVPGPSVRWLIEQGYLSKYRIFSKPGPDLSQIKRGKSDFNQNQLGEAYDNTILGDAVQHYQQHAPGTQAVAFCVNVEHALKIAHLFRKAGINAEELDATANASHRKNTVQRFRDGKIRVLTSVDLFGEGFDLPELTSSILLRPTMSLGLYLQQVGRCLRAAPGKKEAIILDHAGNVARHGLPDDEREWSLMGRKKQPRAKSMKQCPQCYGYNQPAIRACEHCGYEFPVREVEREIQEREGMLKEIDPEAYRQKMNKARQQVGFAARAETDAEAKAALQQIARERGYKPGWVYQQMKLRRQRRSA